jgi:hypothetical protein
MTAASILVPLTLGFAIGNWVPKQQPRRRGRACILGRADTDLVRSCRRSVSPEILIPVRPSD